MRRANVICINKLGLGASCARTGATVVLEGAAAVPSAGDGWCVRRSERAARWFGLLEKGLIMKTVQVVVDVDYVAKQQSVGVLVVDEATESQLAEMLSKGFAVGVKALIEIRDGKATLINIAFDSKGAHRS